MHEYAESGNGFMGTFFFQFQTAYQKGGAELNFGMFGLGEEMLNVSETFGQPVHCLTSRLWAFEQPGPNARKSAITGRRPLPKLSVANFLETACA